MCVRNKFACIVFRKHRRSLNVEKGAEKKQPKKFFIIIFGTKLHCIGCVSGAQQMVAKWLMQDDIGLI